YRQYVLVSAVGANSQSSNFYLRLKGQVEDAICKLPFGAITIFRPSVLIGKRKEKRIGERIGIALVKTFSFLLTGKRSIYKAIQADEVARA
ncbi:oxidoreductase, partial [Rhizobium leguminosarum]